MPILDILPDPTRAEIEAIRDNAAQFAKITPTTQFDLLCSVMLQTAVMFLDKVLTAMPDDGEQ